MNTFLSNTLSRYTRPGGLSAPPPPRKRGLIQAIAGDVPEMDFNISLEPDAKNTLLLFGATIGGGIALAGLFNYLK